MPQSEPEPLSDEWFAAMARRLPILKEGDLVHEQTFGPPLIVDPTGLQTPVLREAVAAALEWASWQTMEPNARSVIRAKAEEIRRD